MSHGPLHLRSRWRLGRDLRSRGYDQAIVLPNSWKSALTPFFADIPLRSGYVGEAGYGLLNLLYRAPPGKDRPDMRLHYARLADAPGAPPPQPLPRAGLRVEPHEIDRVKQRFGIAGDYAVLCPGAEYGPAKRWPYFAELASRLSVPAVILGSASDRDAAQGIGGTNLVGKTSLDEAIALIAGAHAVVSNDSGLMHVAAALDRPQVALFGSSSPEHTPPASKQARVIWLHIECSPCWPESSALLRRFKALATLRSSPSIGSQAASGIPFAMSSGVVPSKA